MAIGFGQNWKGANVGDTGGSVSLSGTTTTAGSCLLFHICCRPVDSITPTTPRGWTLRDSITNITYVYELVNASARTSQSVSYTGGTGGPVNGIMQELTGADTAAPFDAKASTSSGTSTSLVTGSLTTTVANDALVAVFLQNRGASASPPTFSAPTNGFSIEGTQNGATDGTNSLTNAITGKVVSATQSGVSTGLTSNISAAYRTHFLSYSAPSVVVKTSTDSATLTDSGNPVVLSTDSGSLAEVSLVTVFDTDSATLAEAYALLAQVP